MENNKEVRIFNYPWHIAHQFELVQIPNTKWSWLAQHRRQYSDFPRGEMINRFGIEWVPHYEKGKYDFALLHLDQQCFEESIWERGKGSLFREVNSVVTDIPKACIMHGTPFYPENFPCDVTEENYQSLGLTKDSVGMSSELIRRFKEAVKDINVLIFNSHTAKRQWGMENDPRARSFWHGMKEDEWFNLPKEPRVVTMIGPAGLDKYYDRALLRAVKEMLHERNIDLCHITVDATFKSWTEYREFLGRSLVYFNPTKESPMPRSRTEAMMSGCCIISTKGQDVEEFIISGENGIIVPRNPEFIADLIESLILDYKKARELGEKARETALQRFKQEDFQKNWLNIISTIVKK